MNYQPAFDMSWGPALYILGMFAFPFVVVWTLLSEAVTLYLLKFHRSFWRCLGNATAANLMSGVVGIIWQIYFFNISSYFHWVNNLIGSPTIDDYQTLDPRTQILGLALIFLVDWIGSILLEGVLLMIVRFAQWDSSFASAPGSEHQIRYALKISAIINTVSYAGFIIGLFIFL